jgi:Leucine-rich repeat (LRR) protein
LFIDAGNRLTCLPPQLLDITSLRNLFLGANQITELSAGINRLR